MTHAIMQHFLDIGVHDEFHKAFKGLQSQERVQMIPRPAGPRRMLGRRRKHGEEVETS